MEEISPDIQSIRMVRGNGQTYQLLLIASNAIWADMLYQTLGKHVTLTYVYDPAGITFYLYFELSAISKKFIVAVGAFAETLQWLNWIDQGAVASIRVCYRDGKGGLIPLGATIPLRC